MVEVGFSVDQPVVVTARLHVVVARFKCLPGWPVALHIVPFVSTTVPETYKAWNMDISCSRPAGQGRDLLL